jgi:hypothetical protein
MRGLFIGRVHFDLEANVSAFGGGYGRCRLLAVAWFGVFW